MEILTCASSSYIPWVKVAIHSLRKLHGCPIRLTLLYAEPIAGATGLLRYAERHDVELRLFAVNEADFENMLVHRHFSRECYFRFVFLTVYPVEERALWLDVDVAILRSLEPFYDMDFDGSYLIACRNRHQKRHLERLGLYGQENTVYFNAGVMLLNCADIRKSFPERFLFDAYSRFEDRVDLADQDIFNLVFAGRARIADEALYNKQIQFCDETGSKECRHIMSTALLIHYIREIKPWQFGYPHYLGICYLRNMLEVFPVRALLLMCTRPLALLKNKAGKKK